MKLRTPLKLVALGFLMAAVVLMVDTSGGFEAMAGTDVDAISRAVDEYLRILDQLGDDIEEVDGLIDDFDKTADDIEEAQEDSAKAWNILDEAYKSFNRINAESENQGNELKTDIQDLNTDHDKLVELVKEIQKRLEEEVRSLAKLITKQGEILKKQEDLVLLPDLYSRGQRVEKQVTKNHDLLKASLTNHESAFATDRANHLYELEQQKAILKTLGDLAEIKKQTSENRADISAINAKIQGFKSTLSQVFEDLQDVKAKAIWKKL